MRVPRRKDEFMAVSRTQPVYELRARRHGPGDTEIEVWQLPSIATPQITAPIRLAGLRGRNLELVEQRVLKRLKQGGIRAHLKHDPPTTIPFFPRERLNHPHVSYLHQCGIRRTFLRPPEVGVLGA